MKLLEITNLSCFAHDMHNVFGYAYKRASPEITELRNKLSELVTYVKRSNNAKEFLFECQKQVGFEENIMLINQVDTRWNTFYEMLSRILDMKSALALFFQDDRYSNYLINADEWILIKGLTTVLVSLKNATKFVSVHCQHAFLCQHS